jgi:hypothetical protein
MNKLPPQQLSLDFDGAVVPASPPVVSTTVRFKSGKIRDFKTGVAVSSFGTPQIVSLCSFRQVQEQKQALSIYEDILASISHIA